MEFASNAKGNAALTTGIIGTAGVGLALLNGGLGNILGGLGGNKHDAGADAMAMAAMITAASGSGRSGGCGCNEDHLVNRYEAAQQARIAQLETEIKLRDANTYTDQKLLEVYKYFDGELKDVRGTIAAQAVMNQRTADSFESVRNDMICCKNELYKSIQLEAERRRCGDNSIVAYANATFYPKQIADVTVGTTSTAQTLYNPLPNCGCGCG